MFVRRALISLVDCQAALLFVSLIGCTNPVNAPPHPSCRPVEAATGGIPGPEDFDVAYDSAGRATALIVSAQERRNSDTIDERNGIYRIPLGATGRPMLATRLSTPTCRDGPRAYAARPHGISLVQEEGRTTPTLWVINHEPDCPDAPAEVRVTPDIVERYSVEPDRLVPLPDLPRENRYLRNPNDLVGLRDGTLFMTNISHHRSRLLTHLDFIVPSGSVVRYRNGKWSIFDRWYRGSNGIAAVDFSDPSRNDLLHVAEFHDRQIHTIRLDADREAVGQHSVVSVGYKPDNLLVGREPEPQLWVGSHPSLLTIVRHLQSPEHNAPSDVTTVDAERPTQGSVVQRYYFEGPNPNGAATAIEIEDWLYLGQVFDPGLIACGPWEPPDA